MVALAPNKNVFGLYGQKSKRQYYEEMYAALKTDRASFDPHWQDIGRVLQPRRMRFSSTDRNKGDKRHNDIIDSTGTFAYRTLQSGLHAGLTSPARPWFKLGTPDPELAKFGPVKQWLHEVTGMMQTVFSQTNLYNGLPTVYGDLGLFGTGAIGIMPDTRDLFRATTYPIGSYVVSTDSRGMVNLFMREYQMTVYQIVEMFGGPDGTPAVAGREIDWSRISGATKTQWDQGKYDVAMNILWVVAPNREHRPDSPLARHAKFTSCHFERGAETTRQNLDQGAADRSKILRESGFRTFPILVPRWEVTGEDSYGTSCPGMWALGDVRQLQTMQRKFAQAVAKLVDPPLVGPTSLRTQKTSLLPGDVTYADIREGMQGLRSIHEVNIDLQHMVFGIDQVQRRIKTAFYEPLFLMLAQSDGLRGMQPVTAREIEERHEEKLLALGPVLDRTNDELLDPLIDRTYQMMEDAGLLPPPPPDLDQVTLKVEYVSVMAQAQKLVGVVGYDRFLNTMAPLIQFFPQAGSKINIQQVVDDYGDMLGIPPRSIRSNEEADEIDQAAADQQQAMAEAQVAKDTMQAAKLGSEAQLSGGGTALDELSTALTGV